LSRTQKACEPLCFPGDQILNSDAWEEALQESTQRSIEQQTRAMAEAARVAFGAELGGHLRPGTARRDRVTGSSRGRSAPPAAQW